MNSVLIIDDDKELCALMKKCVEQENLSAVVAHGGLEGLRLLEKNKDTCSLIILDVMMPDMNGFQVLQKIREKNNVPVLMLTAKSDEEDKVSGLRLGADDYLTKPFSVDELLARLRVALRRVRYDGDRLGEESSTYENGDMRIDYSAGCVYISDVEIHLTPIEYKLLCLLAKNTGKVLTHNYILKEVWGSPTASDVSSLRVYMATLRRKLEKNSNGVQYIQTHVGIGYRMLRITNK